MKNLLVVVRDIFSSHFFTAVFLWTFIFLCICFQWLLQYEVLWELVSNSALNFGEKVEQIFKAFTRLFTQINDFTPLSIITIALLQSITFMTFFMLRPIKMRLKLKPQILTVAGLGCVACGGSILPYLVGLISASISATLVQLVGNLMLIVAIALSLLNLRESCKMYVKQRG